jgi:hypothetical protein
LTDIWVTNKITFFIVSFFLALKIMESGTENSTTAAAHALYIGHALVFGDPPRREAPEKI